MQEPRHSGLSPTDKAHWKIRNYGCVACLCLALFQVPHTAFAAPLLRCYATYAGETQTIDAHLSNDPYQLNPVDVGGRFKLKAEMHGQASTIDYIKIYAYFQTAHGDVPIHEASYYPPFQLKSEETLFTPMNRLYTGPLERQLQYHCTLQDKNK